MFVGRLFDFVVLKTVSFEDLQLALQNFLTMDALGVYKKLLRTSLLNFLHPLLRKCHQIHWICVDDGTPKQNTFFL